MGLKSYKTGKKFEKELCDYFAKNNYYVIYNEKGIVGAQPFDMLAIRNNICYAIECKNLEKGTKFPLSRIELNQIFAYQRFRKSKNHNFILAILNQDNVYFINFDLLEYYEDSIDLSKIEPNIKDWSKNGN